MFVLMCWPLFTLGSPFLEQKFRLLLPNAGGGGVCPLRSPRRDRAALRRVRGEGHGKRPYGHLPSDPWNLPDSQVQSERLALSVYGRNF